MDITGEGFRSGVVAGCRTTEQNQEEEMLVAELKKIEMRKRERERKQQDLQKLISAAEQNTDRSATLPAMPTPSLSLVVMQQIMFHKECVCVGVGVGVCVCAGEAVEG